MINEFISKTFENRNDNIRKAKPIVDRDVVNTLSDVSLLNDSSDNPLVFHQEQFKTQYDSWIKSSENFKVLELDTFKNRYITNGVTEAFNDFYYLNKNLYVLSGEYTYHEDLGITVVEDVYHIPSYSALIISYPFSASGNVHHSWDRIINVCEERNIKIFIDCCFFGISKVPDLDLSSRAITHVAFSLSKTFSTGSIRTGILYTRCDDVTPLKVQNDHWYTQMAGQAYHSKLLDKFSPDYIYNKYHDKQLEYCRQNDLEPSDTVIFAISTDKEYKYFDRGGYVNRMCISYVLQQFKKDLVV